MRTGSKNYRARGSGRSRSALSAASLGILTVGWLIAAPAQDVADGTLAATIRASGHACEHVIEKQRAGEGASVWRVRCNSGQYQVTMAADGSAQVVQID